MYVRGLTGGAFSIPLGSGSGATLANLNAQNEALNSINLLLLLNLRAKSLMKDAIWQHSFEK